MKNKLILGTVQFGLDYGINNSQGKPSEQKVFELLDYAHQEGIAILDTAAAYGNAPQVIGAYHTARTHRFDIISKFTLNHIQGFESLNDWLHAHLAELQVEKLWGCMFHSFKDFEGQAHLLEELLALKKQGWIERVGVSLYTNEELEIIIDNPSVDFIQLPYNLLDNNLQRGALLKKAQKAGKIIHTRSAFLQGLFFKDIASLSPQLSPLIPSLKNIHHIAKEYHSSILELSLKYPYLNPNIQGVLMGVDSLQQLQSNLEAIHKNIPAKALETIDKLNVTDISLLNPGNWS